MDIRAITWNLFHGRDAPPEPDLFTWRSRLFRRTERGETHEQVNRDLYDEFAHLLNSASWDIALLQECPPRWSKRLAEDCDAAYQRSLTSRNVGSPVRRLIARRNPDLIASGEGGSNTTLVRTGFDEIVEQHDLELTRRPERRTMAFCRLASGLCIANLHATNDRPPRASEELRKAAAAAVDWAGAQPLIFGGDLNLRPRTSPVFSELVSLHSFSEPAILVGIDHLLGRGLEVVQAETAWPPEARDVGEGNLAVRLSDHSPVDARFRSG